MLAFQLLAMKYANSECPRRSLNSTTIFCALHAYLGLNLSRVYFQHQHCLVSIIFCWKHLEVVFTPCDVGDICCGVLAWFLSRYLNHFELVCCEGCSLHSWSCVWVVDNWPTIWHRLSLQGFLIGGICKSTLCTDISYLQRGKLVHTIKIGFGIKNRRKKIKYSCKGDEENKGENVTWRGSWYSFLLFFQGGGPCISRWILSS